MHLSTGVRVVLLKKNLKIKVASKLEAIAPLPFRPVPASEDVDDEMVSKGMRSPVTTGEPRANKGKTTDLKRCINIMS